MNNMRVSVDIEHNFTLVSIFLCQLKSCHLPIRATFSIKLNIFYTLYLVVVVVANIACIGKQRLHSTRGQQRA